MVQNHLLQVLALVAMEPVASFRGDAVRDEKAKVFQAIEPIEDIATQTVRGQYVAGAILGQQVSGYRQEEDVPPTSRTETFAAMRLEIENWRWADVPFYLRVGKRLPKRATEVAITFKQAPLPLFRNIGADDPAPNLLVLRIQPDEGISLRFGAKLPGTRSDVRPVNMDFRYGTAFGVDTARGVRAPARRCHARRLHALHALGRCRSGVDAPVARAGTVAGGRAAP